MLPELKIPKMPKSATLREEQKLAGSDPRMAHSSKKKKTWWKDKVTGSKEEEKVRKRP